MTSRPTALLPLALHFLWLSSVYAASFERCAPAFVVSTTSRVRAASASVSLNEKNRLDFGEDEDGITRRELFRSTALIGAASLIAKPTSARAATETATQKSIPSQVVSNTLCDPSVSTWVKSYDDSMRTVHILGTAHISSASAELAGKMVRDLKPNVVFVELDAKRVARAIPGGINGGSGSGSSGSNAVSGGVAASSTGESSPAPSNEAPTSVAIGAITSTPSDASDRLQKSSPFDVQSKLVDAGSKVVGNSVKSMYGKLESEGFKAGDEFAMSVREGLAIGSTIVLGDRDVEVTLRRLTQAITKTDIRKLLSADSEVEKSMEGLLPEGMKSQLKQPSNGGGGSADGSSMSVTSMGQDDATIDKQDFQIFIETMKAKENVKKIMSALQKTAPEIYEAMVAERDVYMGRGLDELGMNLKESSADNTVAVVGMAHVDGIERYLTTKGWKEMTYPCPVMR
eukprot:CAMPEP_0172300382 /NCGR_PEP_ID=MMETSP1058-20130122/2482_1 /TAXON_ID=83371 /ORGANISM="Detonula confervacea, Strain CCMP 353" /LENGTH=456 /DNA_ID=CAMNT_0013010141 /DNA_START=10 /DNA_END=1380 /DNA_ORIENTATION=+